MSEEPSTYYDTVYRTGGAGGQYHKDPEQTQYHAMWTEVLSRIQPGTKGVFDVGCGPGQTAQMCVGRSIPYVHGVDFSPVAIELAKKRNPTIASVFAVGDILSPAIYASDDYDTIICLEVLEHIDRDTEVVSLWPKGTHCIISVPSYDSVGHVRVFKTEESVMQRYASFFQDVKVLRIPMARHRCIWVMEGTRKG